ncbi:MAG: hypothetical protein R3B70_41005 [Polyangiaceae bacterium]
MLFNGGVMKATALRERLLSTFDAWLAEDGAPPARVLGSADLDLAVARGAAYGLARHGKGAIRGGTAREKLRGDRGAVPAVPVEPPMVAFCVAPFGMEGTHAALPPHGSGSWWGEPVRFRFFGSSVRHRTRPAWSWSDGGRRARSSRPSSDAAGGGAARGRRGACGAVGAGDGHRDAVAPAVPKEPVSPNERFRVELSVRAEA